MFEEDQEYRYSDAARRRAALFAAVAAVVLVVLLALLIQQWAFLSWPTRIFGGLLLVWLLLTIRAQLIRLWFRCRMTDKAVHIITPLSQRTIPWHDMVEVRRLVYRQLGGERRWACAVYTRTRRGTTLPVYLFDDQLEAAEQAMATVKQRTPSAAHNV